MLVISDAKALVLAFPHSQMLKVLCLNHPEGQGVCLAMQESSATDDNALTAPIVEWTR